MICFVIIICKRLGAPFKRTFKRPLIGVNQLEVNFTIVLTFEGLSTLITNKGPLVTVRFFVPFQSSLRWKLSITLVTGEV